MNEILTPCILQTIIICASLLLALLCIISLIKNLYGAKDNCENCHRRKHLSYKFIVGILIFLLVILFSHKFYANDNIFNFMSFASAIISIILAVLTIIYSYYTNETTSSSVEKLGDASNKIEGTLIKVNEATQSYKTLADSLQENIHTILNTIQHVDQTAEKLLTAQGINNKPNSKTLVESMTPDMVKNFVKLSSQRGNVLMYACIKACDQNKPLLLDSIMEDGTFDYCTGFLIAAKSSGLFNLKIWANKNKGIEVIAYHPSLKPALHDLFRDSSMKYYNEMIEKIDGVLQ